MGLRLRMRRLIPPPISGALLLHIDLNEDESAQRDLRRFLSLADDYYNYYEPSLEPLMLEARALLNDLSQ